MAQPTIEMARFHIIQYVRVLGKYELPPLESRTQPIWATYVALVRSNVMRVSKPKPSMMIELNCITFLVSAFVI